MIIKFKFEKRALNWLILLKSTRRHKKCIQVINIIDSNLKRRYRDNKIFLLED